MCRSIKRLRKTDSATDDEIRAAALQFVRKISGYHVPARKNEEAFADALDQATGLGANGTRMARDTTVSLRKWKNEAWASPSALGDMTARLVRAEKELLEAIRAEEDPAVLAAMLAQTDHDLEPYRARMPARVLDQIREEAWARGLLARHGLPRLSLFHL